MGWASGSVMMIEIIVILKSNVRRKETREKIYEGFIDIFLNEDCDTLSECLGEDEPFDNALKRICVDEFEEYEDGDEEHLGGW